MSAIGDQKPLPKIEQAEDMYHPDNARENRGELSMSQDTKRSEARIVNALVNLQKIEPLSEVGRILNKFFHK